MSQNAPNTKQWLLRNFFSLAAIGVAVVNLFLAYRLSPIVADLQDFGHRIKAVETDIAKHQDDSARLFDSINTKLDQVKDIASDIKSRVSRIEGKLEK